VVAFRNGTKKFSFHVFVEAPKPDHQGLKPAAHCCTLAKCTESETLVREVISSGLYDGSEPGYVLKSP
jgi:hypothetical protein